MVLNRSYKRARTKTLKDEIEIKRKKTDHIKGLTIQGRQSKFSVVPPTRDQHESQHSPKSRTDKFEEVDV